MFGPRAENAISLVVKIKKKCNPLISMDGSGRALTSNYRQPPIVSTACGVTPDRKLKPNNLKLNQVFVSAWGNRNQITTKTKKAENENRV